MPIPASEMFTPEMLQLIELIEKGLHQVARSVETRDQAIVVKARILSPIGLMGSRFGLQKTRAPWRNGLTRQIERE